MTYEITLQTSTHKIIHIIIRDLTLKFTNTLTFYARDSVYLTRFSYCKKKIVNHLVILGYVTIVEIPYDQFVEDTMFKNYILQLTSKALLELI
jgi:hypothetical protein